MNVVKETMDQPFSDHDIWEISHKLATDKDDDCKKLSHLIHKPRPDLKWVSQSEDLSNDRLKFLLQWWQTPTKDEESSAIPSVDSVDPFILQPALGNVMLLDVINAGEDFVYRLYGTEIAARAGWDLTGQKLSQVESPHVNFFMATYRAILLKKRPLYTKHLTQIGVNSLSWKWERLLLPLEKDASIQRILVGIHASG